MGSARDAQTMTLTVVAAAGIGGLRLNAGVSHMSETTTKDVTSLLADGTATGSWLLDPAGSCAGFRVKHFWGAITVHGMFERMTGEAIVRPDGTVTGRISFDVNSINTKHKQRDNHLRSADFFHGDKHPHAILTVTSARPAGPSQLECEGTFEAAGHARSVTFTAYIERASAQRVVLAGELAIDRGAFGMTWSPLHMASMTARGTFTARFTHHAEGSTSHGDRR
jgi:polyisoprenoid-binding protein YceI